MQRTTTTNPLEAHRPDILNSDIHSHWQSLQHGRYCQNKQYPGSVICPTFVLVPPMYLQGRFPWDGMGSPLAANMNLFLQLMGYGPRHVPAAPLQAVSSRPDGVYQRYYVEELSRYRSGIGTYLLNPKVPMRERHTSGAGRTTITGVVATMVREKGTGTQIQNPGLLGGVTTVIRLRNQGSINLDQMRAELIGHGFLTGTNHCIRSSVKMV